MLPSGQVEATHVYKVLRTNYNRVDLGKIDNLMREKTRRVPSESESGMELELIVTDSSCQISG